MKKTSLFMAAALLFSIFSATAQTDTTKVLGNANVKTKTMVPMPEALTTEKIFPVLGSYQSTQSNIEGAGNVTIVLDPEYKGIVWIEGLPIGKIKAMLRRSPSTYKIPAQKTEDGKAIAEGTLVYDKDNNVLNLCLGCEYNSEDPATPFTMTTDVSTETDVMVKTDKKTKTKSTKSKSKTPKVQVWRYTGSKIGTTTPMNN